MEEDRPTETEEQLEISIIGKIYEHSKSFDNGFYTNCKICGVNAHYLIDSGSTSTLLSHRIYQKIDPSLRPQLKANKFKVKNVNGIDINVYGHANISIKLGKNEYFHQVIVCDISPDGILGQDFMLEHVKKIDYEKYMLHTETGQISCWLGGNSSMTCRVIAEETTYLPANSSTWISVKIPSQEHMETKTAFVEPIESQSAYLLPGVIKTGVSEESRNLNVVNGSEDCVTIYPNTTLGNCISVRDDPIQIMSCNTQTLLEQPSCGELPEYLNDLFTRSSVHLDENEQNQLKSLLIKYQSVFAKSSDDLGFSDRVEHHIDTMGAEPIKEHVRRLPLAKREIEREEVRKMLQKGVIEPSISPWSSNIVLVTKKDGSTRFCVDYRKLNAVTKKDSYPLPDIRQCLDALADSAWFSCMDINAGYWQIGVKPEDREKTAFATSMGLYQFVKMPFGLVAAPSDFCRLMGDIFRDIQWIECLIYMDDIIVPAKTIDETLVRLEHVFQRLQQANLKLKPSKCVFMQKSVKFLGHEVSALGINTDKDKIKAVQEWPVPRTVKQVRSFVGLAAYYKRFIASFGEICKPLYQLCEKNRQFLWSLDCQHAFETLKDKLTTAPILAYPVMGKDFILDTDASQFTVGAVLSQEHDGKERVIAYMSKTMNKSELQYCTTRKELLAVITALKHFHIYLIGQKVRLRTDNSAVSWIRTLKNPTGQVFRWLQYIETYDLSVTHRPGRSHGNSDALSRIPCKVCQRQEQNESKDTNDHNPDLHNEETMSINMTTVELSRAVTRGQQQSDASAQLKSSQFLLEDWEPSNIRQNQLSDPLVSPIMVAVESQSRPEWKDISDTTSYTKTLWRQWDRLSIISGMLYRKWVSDDLRETKYQLIVPETLQLDVLSNYHDIPSAGHLGSEKMLSRIQEHFYWPAMKDKIELYCKLCDICQSRKPSKLTKAPLGQDPVSEPMEKVTIDVLGPLPVSHRSNRHILVITDCFTKWTEAIAMPDQEAATIATTFVNNFITRYGVPLLLLSDGSTNFDSKLFREVCKFLQIEKVKTSVMRPQANGVTERFNRTLATMLTMYCTQDQKDWDLYLPQVMMAYRSSVHSSTGQSPNKMVYGREIMLPMAAVIGQPKGENPGTVEDYVKNLQVKLQQVHQLARTNLKKTANYRKKHYDIKSSKRVLASGQAVWLYEPSKRPGVCAKLTPKWKGPALVLQKLDDLTYLVKMKSNTPAKIYHIDRLRAYQGNSPPKWFAKALKKHRNY